jgi:hypothetical protein
MVIGKRVGEVGDSSWCMILFSPWGATKAVGNNGHEDDDDDDEGGGKQNRPAGTISGGRTPFISLL